MLVRSEWTGPAFRLKYNLRMPSPRYPTYYSYLLLPHFHTLIVSSNYNPNILNTQFYGCPLEVQKRGNQYGAKEKQETVRQQQQRGL